MLLIMGCLLYTSSGATTKITSNNRRLNRLDFEKNILIPLKGDRLDEYREDYNKILLEKATGANAIVQDKYMTISAVSYTHLGNTGTKASRRYSVRRRSLPLHQEADSSRHPNWRTVF